MKTLYKLLSILLLFIFSYNITIAQTPTYNLRAMNFAFYGCPHKIIEFDVYIEHTNAPTPFIYAVGQYFFDFNPSIANGGILTYTIVGSDLRSDMIPRNPTISGTQLRLAVNSIPVLSNAINMTNNGYPGTKIVRMRLTTTAAEMAGLPGLVWRSALPNPYTKITAYIGSTLVEITSPSTHTVTETFSPNCETFLLNSPGFNSTNNNLPVSLSWYRAGSAVSYKVEVATDQNFSDIIFTDSTVTDTFKAITDLNLNYTYYWKVHAHNGSNYYITSPVWYFKTGNNTGGTIPEYMLYAKNFYLNSPQDNELEFEIYIQQTNPPAVFEYSGGQYFLKFNPNIANGGTLSYSLLSSDLPVNFRPGSISIVNASNPPETVMAMSINFFPSAGNGYMISPVFPGTKIARMKLSTTASSFAIDTAGIYWRDRPIISLATKIYAYVGNANVEITTPVNHFIDYNMDPLPVELSAFSFLTDRNKVKLNWTTVKETNNRSFIIERRSEGPEQWIISGNVEGNGNSNEIRQYSFTDNIQQPGKYNYRLKQVDYNGNFRYYELTGDVEVGIPDNFNVSQNYPNPFNPFTKIDFDLPDDGKINLTIYDISGREISKLLNEERKAGYYSVQFNGGNLASGIYFYRMNYNNGNRNYVMTKKMMLVK